MVDGDLTGRDGSRLVLAALAIGLACLAFLSILQAAFAAVGGLVLVGWLACRWRKRLAGIRGGAQRSSPEERRFRALLENLPKVAVQGYDKHRRVIYWNEASVQLYGYRADEAIGRRLEELLVPDSLHEAVIAAHRAWIEDGVAIPPGELVLTHKSGAPVAVFSHHVMLGQDGHDPLMFCVDVALRELPQARHEFELVSGFGALTRMAERPVFDAELDARLANSRRQGGKLAVIAIGIDIDPPGDGGRVPESALLDALAKRLAHARGTNLLARFGDGFVMVAFDVRNDGDVLALLERIFEAVGQRVVLSEREWDIAVSLGVSVFPDNGATVHELIHRADVAKRRARLAGPNSYWFFDQRLHDELNRQYRLMERLRGASRDGEFILRYRPRKTAKGERIEGLEVCLHWPSHGGRAPFPIDLGPAERSTLMLRLGDWLMQEACLRRTRPGSSEAMDWRVAIDLPGERAMFDGILQRLGGTPDGLCSPPQRKRCAREERGYTIRLEAASAPDEERRR